MLPLPSIPESAPFNAEQRVWLDGYLAGLFSRAAARHASLDLSTEPNVFIVTSTYGEGEMPDNAQAFWLALTAGTAPALSKTKFSVLALGDTNYVKFCQAGKDFDARFEALGATRFHPRADCDCGLRGTRGCLDGRCPQRPRRDPVRRGSR